MQFGSSPGALRAKLYALEWDMLRKQVLQVAGNCPLASNAGFHKIYLSAGARTWMSQTELC